MRNSVIRLAASLTLLFCTLAYRDRQHSQEQALAEGMPKSSSKAADALGMYKLHYTQTYKRVPTVDETIAFSTAYNMAQKIIEMVAERDSVQTTTERKLQIAADGLDVSPLIKMAIEYARLDFNNDQHMVLLGVSRDDMIRWRQLLTANPPPQRAPTTPSLRPTA